MSSSLAPRWSASFLAALATAAVPGLQAVATRRPRLVTTTVEVTGVLDSEGRSWIVRAPRDTATGAALMAEGALTTLLSRQHLPFAVAAPAGSAELPGGDRAVVHREVPGHPLDLLALAPGSALATSLGAALAALHELAPESVADGEVSVYDAATCRTRLLAELDEMAATGLVPPVLLRRWEAALEDVRNWHFTTVLVHGDLGAERVLVTGDEVSGVLDFATAHVGDPALDLGWLVAAAPEDALETVLDAYQGGRRAADDHLLVRAQLYSELALGRWLLHGQRAGEPEVVTEAQEMLTELADAVLAAGADS